jgi:hypothetical protein
VAEPFYRSVVTVEVLHRGELVFDDLANLHELIDSGPCSGEYSVKTHEVTEGKMRKLLEAQRSSPDFFAENGE